MDLANFDKITMNLEDKEQILRPSMGYWKDSFRRFKENKIAVVLTIYIIILFFGSILVPVFSSYSISDQELMKQNLSIGEEGHIFGTDGFGRDIFVRVWYGARISLFIAFVAAFVDLIIGVLYGGISGYFGGKVDQIMTRIIDVIQAIPFMIFAILLAAILEPGIFTIIIAYAILGWTNMARQVRGLVLQIKNQEYVLAARVLGANSRRIMYKHIFPNVIGIVVVTMTLTIPSAMFTEAFLSYIGLGVPLPQASWGTLASDAAGTFISYPSQLFIPAIFISLTILSFNLIGDALRDALDPKLRK
ncbi:MAG: ABC transporter permease [Clostridiales bacterium]